MKENKWVRLLAYITELVNQELLLQNEFLAAENRILRAHLPSPLRLSDPQRSTLAKSAGGSGVRLWPKWPASPSLDTILGWYRKLIAQKFDGSKHRSYPGRPPVEAKLEALIVQIAEKNSGWGYETSSIFSMYSSSMTGTHHIFSPPRLQFVALEQNADRLTSHPRHQFPLHRFLGNQADRPTSLSLWRLGADHGDDTLFVSRLQHRYRARSLLLIERPFQTALQITMGDGTNGLGREFL